MEPQARARGAVGSILAQTARIKTPVLDVAYEQSGPHDALPVLLLHGFPYDPRGFDEFVRMLSEHSPLGHSLTMASLQSKRPTLWDMETDLKKFSVPLLVICGDGDETCLDGSVFLKRTAPTAALLVVPRSGHTITSEEPDAVNAALAFQALAYSCIDTSCYLLELRLISNQRLAPWPLIKVGGCCDIRVAGEMAEWAGNSLISVDWAPPNRRVFWQAAGRLGNLA